MRRWLIPTGNVLICLCLRASFCAGRELPQYIYEAAEENHFVREFTGESDSHPDFIFSPHYSNGRIVTYYAHWCPHCQHFKPVYIDFSNKIHEMSEKLHAVIETFAVSCVPQAKICKDKKIHGYPTVIYYPPYSIKGEKLKYFDLHPQEIFRMAGVSTDTETIGDKAVVVTQHYPSKSSQKSNKISPTPYFIQRSRIETFHDAHISFDFAMKTAIFTQTGPLPEKPKKALQDFLLAMKRTLPRTSSMQPLVRDLLNNFEHIVTSSASLNEIMTKYPPPEPSSSWSQASSQHGTGYTAGLWILFHIMSVGLVQWNHFAKNDEQKLVPAVMADIQRNYIEHFFQCEACRLNFLSDFDACMYDRCNRLTTTVADATLQQFIQYPLWLYETHNAINIRLRKERIEQSIEKENFTTQREVVWPAYSSCPSCWASSEKDRWDEIEIYNYLQHSYWLEDHESEVLEILSHGEAAFKIDGSMGRTEIDVDDDGFDFYSTGSWCCLVLMILVVWYRRRQYDRRGMHKKIEVDIA